MILSQGKGVWGEIIVPADLGKQTEASTFDDWLCRFNRPSTSPEPAGDYLDYLQYRPVGLLRAPSADAALAR